MADVKAMLQTFATVVKTVEVVDNSVEQVSAPEPPEEFPPVVEPPVEGVTETDAIGAQTTVIKGKGKK